MTDAALAPARPRYRPSKADSDARTRRRYNSERRFQLYGLAAIAFSAIFIVVLMTDVITKAIPAFTVHQAVVEVELPAAAIDPAGTRDPQTLRTADYDALVRDVFDAKFPYVETRADRRALRGLLSAGGTNELRNRVANDPSLVGTTVRAPILLGPNPDLYLKGRVTGRETFGGVGTATPSATTGAVTIFSTSNDFANLLIDAKQDLLRRSVNLRREAERVRANALAATGDDRRRFDEKIADLEAETAALKARHDNAGSAEAIDASLPSVHVAINGGLVRVTELANDRVTGDVMIPLAGVGDATAGTWSIYRYEVPEANRKVTDREIVYLNALRDAGLIERSFNWPFFTNGNSSEAELAGIAGGIMGSLLTMFVTLILSLPIGVLAAIYLEEFAPKNRWTELIEVNINNLAAVPSIVFGLFGLAVFLNFFGMPRSAPIVGGIVIALMTLPTIIIAARAALRAVPPSIREAALGVGASHQQAVFHHVLPLAMPGIMTGTIVGMASALGETAPLIMIGMVVFTTDIPTTFTQVSNVLPVLVFSWADQPELAFQAKTAAAIIVLLVFLFLMNGLAIYLRKRFERKW
jgi:phosphate transport system permease protein